MEQSKTWRLPAVGDLLRAEERIAASIFRTPVVHSVELDRETGATLFFKCENRQRAGSFKFRGALNKTLCLTDAERARGVAAHSSGNHGLALGTVAALFGIPAYVVVPENTSRLKLRRIAASGAQLTLCGPTHEDREHTLAHIIAETGATEVHSSGDVQVIAGAGTAALELIQEVPRLDDLVVPVGGGGVISGSILAARHAGHPIRIYGAEPMGANDAARSLRAGRLVTLPKVETLVDGLRAPLTALTFEMIREGVREIIEVTDEEVTAAQDLLESVLLMAVEVSSATTLAAIGKRPELFAGRRVGVILTGGNACTD